MHPAIGRSGDERGDLERRLRVLGKAGARKERRRKREVMVSGEVAWDEDDEEGPAGPGPGQEDVEMTDTGPDVAMQDGGGSEWGEALLELARPDPVKETYRMEVIRGRLAILASTSSAIRAYSCSEAAHSG